MQTGTISGLHFGSLKKKCHLDVALAESCREYYMGEGGESSESKLPVACPNTKGVPECELTHLWLVLDVGSCK
jgi:hypothetical protein